MTKLLPSTYAPLLADLKARVRAAQVKAAVSVNRELMRLYWHIGRAISKARQAGGWGANVVERLAKDLAAEFPEMGGFSYTNVKRMRAFAEAYGAIKNGPQSVGHLAASETGDELGPQPVGQLPGAIVAQAARQFEDEPPEPLSLLSWGSCAEDIGEWLEPGGADGANRIAAA